MSLKASGEFDFIERLQIRFSRPLGSERSYGIARGIGDDAAALLPSKKKLRLFTTDALVEGIHFKRRFSSFQQVGYKALAVNVSDIAAMGGQPRFFLVSLGLPEDVSLRKLSELYRGLERGMREYGTDLIGGNTSAIKGPFFISITLIGEVDEEEMLPRDGAKAGDLLFVTGSLGDAAAGLERLQKGLGPSRRSALVQRQLRPGARLREGRLLAQARIPSAMIDVSDGLAADLGHILKQSGLGAELDLSRIPLSSALKRHVKQHAPEKSPLDYALYGGEDYELLFSVPEEKLPKLEALIRSGALQAARIGRLLDRGKGLLAEEGDGRRRKLRLKGYDHFDHFRRQGFAGR